MNGAMTQRFATVVDLPAIRADRLTPENAVSVLEKAVTPDYVTDLLRLVQSMIGRDHPDPEAFKHLIRRADEVPEKEIQRSKLGNEWRPLVSKDSKEVPFQVLFDVFRHHVPLHIHEGKWEVLVFLHGDGQVAWGQTEYHGRYLKSDEDEPVKNLGRIDYTSVGGDGETIAIPPFIPHATIPADPKAPVVLLAMSLPRSTEDDFHKLRLDPRLLESET